MRFKNAILSIGLASLLSITGLAQSDGSRPQSTDGEKTGNEASDKKAVEKKALGLLDETLKEAEGLRLPENRIRLQANAADLLWKHNEKRARELFKKAMDALSELLLEDGADEQPSGFRAIPEYPLLGQAREQLRQEILQMIGQRDGKLAREFLRATNRSNTAKALAERGLVSNIRHDEYDPELQIELGLAAGIAATDPAQALEIAEESLDRGLAQELAVIVQQLAIKDKAAAGKLVAAVMKRLRSANLVTDRSAGSLAILLLRMTFRQDDDDSSDQESSSDLLDDKTIRELIDIVSAAALSRNSGSEGADDEDLPYLLDGLQSMMAEIQKYAPSRAEALNKKFAAFNKKLDPDTKAMVDYQRLIEHGDLNSLVEATAKAPAEVRDSLWSQVAMRAANDGDIDRARQIIAEHFDGSPQANELLAHIESQTLRRAADAGKLEDARHLLTRVPVAERVSLLMQLALRANAKGDKKSALRLLEEARALIGAKAVNATELGALLEIARAYATVEPARSFEIVEPMIDQLNGLLGAAAVLDGFEHTRYFKDGELLPHSGQSLLITVVVQCENDMSQVARADFDRAKAAADRFQAPEVRLMARLAIAQGILLNDPHRVSFFSSIRSGPYGGRMGND
jgi:hypothetical protein